jgi:hypothetical protein
MRHAVLPCKRVCSVFGRNGTLPDSDAWLLPHRDEMKLPGFDVSLGTAARRTSATKTGVRRRRQNPVVYDSKKGRRRNLHVRYFRTQLRRLLRLAVCTSARRRISFWTWRLAKRQKHPRLLAKPDAGFLKCPAGFGENIRTTGMFPANDSNKEYCHAKID